MDELANTIKSCINRRVHIIEGVQTPELVSSFVEVTNRSRWTARARKINTETGKASEGSSISVTEVSEIVDKVILGRCLVGPFDGVEISKYLCYRHEYMAIGEIPLGLLCLSSDRTRFFFL
ncbi:hypothetical protein FXO38_35850 [Capsicum annuum]|nr:hypothetical protein FXO38_35850 [Capsicum annuum]KAF3671224.1 hypothetical protein FXO37_08150 [Capsicum annuum]